MTKYIGKKQIAKTERTNYHVNEFKHSNIYLAQAPNFVKDDIHVLNVMFTNLFSCEEALDINQRQNIICWGAEGMVVMEGKNQTISKKIAKEVSLALHLDLPVWTMRGYKLEPVYAVIKDWQGVKENEEKWASVLIEGQDIPRSNATTVQSSIVPNKSFKLN